MYMGYTLYIYIDTYHVVHAHAYMGYTPRPYTPHSCTLYTAGAYPYPATYAISRLLSLSHHGHLHMISAAARCKHTALSCVLLLLASPPAPAASAVPARGLRDALLRLLHFAVQVLLHVLLAGHRHCTAAVARPSLLTHDCHAVAAATNAATLVLQLIYTGHFRSAHCYCSSYRYSCRCYRWRCCCRTCAAASWLSPPYNAGTACLASHRIASHRIASHRIAAHRIAAHRIASHRIASHRIASLPIVSHRIAAHRIASHRIASHRIASHRSASHRIAPHRCPSHRIASLRIASHRIASLRIASHRIASHRFASLRRSASRGCGA